MDILFGSAKIKKLCSDSKKMTRKLGDKTARRLLRRLDDLHAAASLEVMRTLPGRCHELKGDRDGQLSLDLEHPNRLILEPANDPVPCKPDGGLDWSSIDAVRIIGIEDTHD